jgi:hypothetical protein
MNESSRSISNEVRQQKMSLIARTPLQEHDGIRLFVNFAQFA